jgi:hypothetical protein
MKKILLTLAVALSTVISFAQDKEEKEKGFQRDKLFVGGNFGLSLGSYTFVNISPQLGYRFSRHFAAGAGINFQYAGLKEKYTTGELYRKTAQGVAGLNVFGRVYPVQFIMLQVQPEANYVFGKETYYNPGQVINFNKVVPSLLAGGGLVFPSGRGAMIISVFYDVLKNQYSPYSNKPIFNFSYNVGL